MTLGSYRSSAKTLNIFTFQRLISFVEMSLVGSEFAYSHMSGLGWSQGTG